MTPKEKETLTVTAKLTEKLTITAKLTELTVKLTVTVDDSYKLNLGILFRGLNCPNIS